MVFEITSIFFLLAAIAFSIWLKFPQFKMINKIKCGANQKSLSALFISLASHIGTGNIIGVMTGIFIGGPGVIFWMWIYAFFSMSFALIENSYAVKFHKQDSDNDQRYYGGTILSIQKGLNKKRLALLFGISIFLTNTFLFPPLQLNAIVESIKNLTNTKTIYIALIIILFFIFYIYRGNQKITAFIDLLVPIMAVTYIVVILFLILMNYRKLPYALYTIVNSALNFKVFSVSTIFYTMSIGIRRSFFSNEAGLGTTPSFAGSTNSSDVTIQGYYQMLGVVIDTLFMCTITGILIIQINPSLNNNLSSTVIMDILDYYLPSFGKYLGLFFLMSFALSSIIGEFVMAENNLHLLVKNNHFSKIFIRIVFSITILFGSYFTLAKALYLIDYGLVILGIINVYSLYQLEKKYRLFTQKKDGKKLAK